MKTILNILALKLVLKSNITCCHLVDVFRNSRKYLLLDQADQLSFTRAGKIHAGKTQLSR